MKMINDYQNIQNMEVSNTFTAFFSEIFFSKNGKLFSFFILKNSFLIVSLSKVSVTPG